MKRIRLSRTIRIPLIYCVFSVLWIVLSDRLTLKIADTMESATLIAIIKGTAFVITSTLLIYFFLRVDEKKQASLENELHVLQDSFSVLYEKNPQPMLIEDPDNLAVVATNEAAQKIFEYTKEEFQNIFMTNLVVPEESDLVKATIGKYFSGSRKTGPWRAVTRTGKVFYAYVMIIQIDYAGKIADLVTVIDITEQKEIESNLKKTETERDSFEAFGFSISHDLRSSLRAISGYSQILDEDYHKVLDQKGLDYLEKLRQASQSMNQMIDNLLMLTGITHRNLTLNFVNLSEVVRQISEQLLKQDPHRDAEFVIIPEVIARCDSDLIRIALFDLMENAWKYTSKKPSTRIEFGIQVNQNGERVFFIKDNGAGFDPKKIDNMFKPFQRFHPATEFKGSGVGLSVVSRIIERHNGSIWAEGAEEQGATFFFTLRMDDEEYSV